MNEMKKITQYLRAVGNGEMTMDEAIEKNDVLKAIHAKYPIAGIISGWQIHVCDGNNGERTVARFAIDDSVENSIHIPDFSYYGPDNSNLTVVADSVCLLEFLTDVFFQHGYEKVKIKLDRMDFHLTEQQRVDIVEKAGFIFLPFSWENAVKFSDEWLSKTYNLEKEFAGKLGGLNVNQYLSCLQAAHYYLCAYDYEATLPYVEDKGSLDNGMQWISYRAEAIQLLEGIKQEKEISALDFEMVKIIIKQYEDFQNGITEDLENLKVTTRISNSTYFGINVTIEQEALQTLEEHYNSFVEVIFYK